MKQETELEVWAIHYRGRGILSWTPLSVSKLVALKFIINREKATCGVNWANECIERYVYDDRLRWEFRRVGCCIWQVGRRRGWWRGRRKEWMRRPSRLRLFVVSRYENLAIARAWRMLELIGSNGLIFHDPCLPLHLLSQLSNLKPLLRQLASFPLLHSFSVVFPWIYASPMSL